MNVLQGGVVSTSPNPQAGGPPLVGCRQLLIRSYPPYRRPFLYPQPEDAPCRGDRDPLPEPSASEVELAIDKLKSHKSPGIDQIPAELIRTGCGTICLEIHKFIISIW